MTRLTTVLCLLFLSFTATGQKIGPVQDNSRVGFGCGEGGMPTKSVSKMERLLSAKDYAYIRALIISGNKAEKFMAIVICEELQHRGQLTIFGTYTTHIAYLKNCDWELRFCSGCTYRNTATFKELFNQQEPIHPDYKRTMDWVIQKLNEQI